MKFFAILLLAASSPVLAATPWETYLDLPTPQHAATVSAIEYTHPPQGGYDSNDLEILQDQIAGLDADSFRLAFRLYKREGSGGLAEELGVILSKSIRSHPRFFLQQVAASDATCARFRWILNTPGLEYVDREGAAAYELRMRQVSLRGIKDKALANIRNNCVRLIEPL
jgi:hypothetical protein